MSSYITSFWLTRGFFIALTASAFLYLAWADWSHPLPNTILALLALWLLLTANRKEWMAGGFFIGIFWFWWIMMSFRFYGFPWAIPIGILLVAAIYALLFWTAALLSEWIEKQFNLSSVWPKALFLLTASYLHPFGFDWFKPELMLLESYLGIEKWQFGLILLAVSLAITKRNLLYLFIVIATYQPQAIHTQNPVDTTMIKLVTTHIPIETKWDPRMLTMQIDLVKQEIEKTIKESDKKIIVFPESVLPLFLNREEALQKWFEEKSQSLSIVLGALKWDDGVPRNSTYIFDKGSLQIVDKVVLVPFGESNPLPEWLSKWVNKIFYDGAVDYQASGTIADYTLGGQTYRNAICYEACSETLYEGRPERMIVLSNNGWFIPSIEPTEQRLLLQYYSRKYGTTIYHSINMSPSYIIQNGKVIWEDKKSSEKGRTP